MAKILITEFMDQAAVDSLSPEFDVTYDPSLGDDPARLYPMLADIDGLIVRTSTQVVEDLLTAAPKLQCIGRLGVGLDNFDLDACARYGVPVYPSIGANALSVAEYVVTTSTALLRNAYYRNDQMIAGAWPRKEAQGSELAGLTLGIIGYGNIGRLVAKMMGALDMRVIASDPYVEASDEAWGKVDKVTQSDLLAQADVVTLHCPLTSETRHLIDAARVSQMKEGAVLINAARGGVIDDQAIVDGLLSGHLRGAAIDVFENEPLTAGAAAKFKGVPNLILTPHIAGVTHNSNARVSAVTAENVAKFLRSSQDG